MEKYTEDQITRANEVNLVRFLSSRGERFKKAGREYRWEKHDSVTICENKWYRHSQGKGGWPVDFMMEFYDLSFPDAVKELLDGEEARDGLKTSLSEKRAIPYVEDGGLAVADPIPTKEMVLPEADENQDHMHLAAACTNRKELPNELPMDSFNVFYQTAEDGIGDTIKPRLMQCGADMERVRVIVEDDAMLSLTDPRLELAIKQNNVKLLIMDPIQAYLGPDVDMNRANEIRPLFRYLGGVAERTGAAIVLIGHLNKNAGTHANYRGLGSVDISAAVRSILLVGKVEKETERDVRVVIQTKSSLAPKPTPVAFTLENSKLEWIGEYEITEQELMSGKAGKQKETKLEQAMKLIRQILTTRNLMYVADLDAEGKKLKISDRTMRDARRKLEDELDYGYENSKKTICLKK